MLRIHVLQHVPFEGPAYIAHWAMQRGHSVEYTRLWTDDALPVSTSFDALVVMGGPMGVYDDHMYPWLRAEKAFISNSISWGKKILAICLGAQLIAESMGAVVRRNEHKEIGWFPVRRNPAGLGEWDSVIPQEFLAFHWHGDTFGLPEGALPLGSSDACAHQGFIADDRIIALQFHLESTPQSVEDLLENGAEDLVVPAGKGNWVWSADKIRNQSLLHAPQSNAILVDLLDMWQAC